MESKIKNTMYDEEKYPLPKLIQMLERYGQPAPKNPTLDRVRQALLDWRKRISEQAQV